MGVWVGVCGCVCVGGGGLELVMNVAMFSGLEAQGRVTEEGGDGGSMTNDRNDTANR